MKKGLKNIFCKLVIDFFCINLPHTFSHFIKVDVNQPTLFFTFVLDSKNNVSDYFSL